MDVESWMGRTVTVIRGLEPMPAAFRRVGGDNLDKSPADRRANVQRQTTTHVHIHTSGQFRFAYSPTPEFISFNCGRKWQYQREPTQKGRTHKPHRKKIPLLWGNMLMSNSSNNLFTHLCYSPTSLQVLFTAFMGKTSFGPCGKKGAGLVEGSQHWQVFSPCSIDCHH